MSKTVVAPELWHVPRRTVSHASNKVRRTIGVLVPALGDQLVLLAPDLLVFYIGSYELQFR